MKCLKLFAVPLACLLLYGCWGTGTDDDFVNPSSQYKAVTMMRSQLEASIKLKPAQAVTDAGKIYIKDDMMYITEKNKGFHVYNYQNPANPTPVAFIEVPGATDVAIRNNNLYINQAVDLVTLTYNGSAITVTGRVRNIFPQKQAPDNSIKYLAQDEVIVNWIPKS